MSPGGSGTRADNITSDQTSPKDGVDTLADDDSAMTPRDAPDDAPDDAPEDGSDDGSDERGERDAADDVEPYRDEEE